MEDNKKLNIDFFLGANSPKGFYSYFYQLENFNNYKNIYLIKGSAGNGKSTLLKTIAKKSNEKITEFIHCSSDVSSLDGIIFYNLAFIDATRPHYMEPKYWGVYEKIIDLYQALNTNQLHINKEKIINISNNISSNHNLCCEYLNSCSQLISINLNFQKVSTNFQKLDKAINLLKNQILNNKKINNKTGSEKIRLLSAVTNQDFICFEDTIKSLSDNVIVITDNYGYISNYILNKLRNEFIENGYDIYSCFCPLFPNNKLEHIIIPELNLSIITQNDYLKFTSIKPSKIINSKRFYSKFDKATSYIINFNKKQIKYQLVAAISYLKEAKKLHDELESLYKPYIDFNKINSIVEHFIQNEF